MINYRLNYEFIYILLLLNLSVSLNLLLLHFLTLFSIFFPFKILTKLIPIQKSLPFIMGLKNSKASFSFKPENILIISMQTQRRVNFWVRPTKINLFPIQLTRHAQRNLYKGIYLLYISVLILHILLFLNKIPFLFIQLFNSLSTSLVIFYYESSHSRRWLRYSSSSSHLFLPQTRCRVRQ